MNNKTKQSILIIGCVIFAFVITYLFKENKTSAIQQQWSDESSVISQKVTDKSLIPHSITKMYYEGNLVGMVKDTKKIDSLLKEVYENNYKEDFPDSSMGLNADIYITNELSYFSYEDVDDKIIDYIKENSLYSLEVNRIEFSNGAVVFVKNIEDFNEAKELYLLNFVDQESLDLISVNQLPEELTTYGERIIDIQVAEQITVTKGYASIEDIKKNVQEVLYFLSYGYGTEMETYTTTAYDTVEGVASKVGLSAQQLITLNSDILKSEKQLLTEGMVLNTTFFNSPINIIVTKERIAKEVVYAGSTIYKPDSSLREGMNYTVVEEENGSKNVYYKEVFHNGELSSQEVLKEEITLAPIREVVRYGTKIIPGIGSGKFRYPVDNPKVTCHVGCYKGHTGTDIINRVNKSGPVRAADRGTIQKVGYNSINGYYVWINHNNGWRTYYGHMASPCYFKVGVNVNKGEIIGQIGQTGLATGRHVHFVVEYKGVRKDACNYLGC